MKKQLRIDTSQDLIVFCTVSQRLKMLDVTCQYPFAYIRETLWGGGFLRSQCSLHWTQTHIPSKFINLHKHASQSKWLCWLGGTFSHLFDFSFSFWTDVSCQCLTVIYECLSPSIHPSVHLPLFPPFIHLPAGLSLCIQDVFLSCSGDLSVKPVTSSSSRTGLGQY